MILPEGSCGGPRCACDLCEVALLLLLLLGLENKLLPEAGDLVELGHGGSSGAQGASEGCLFLEEGVALRFEGFFLRDSLAMQDGEAELEVADLAMIALALLLQGGVPGTQRL